jgi:uncharacterized protein YndB with AHSA1/START domain
MTAKVEAPLELAITRTFNAPARTVFAIWTTREHMIKWWGPKDFETTHLELDFRVGGAYRACIYRADYGENWMHGRFVEIVPNERIVFTFQWEGKADGIGAETLITVTFSEHDGKTTQTFHQAPVLDTDLRDSHIGGWSELIDKEQTYAEHMAQGAV